MPKFKTCKNCGSAEDVGILVRNCPGCGAKYEPDMPQSPPSMQPTRHGETPDQCFRRMQQILRGREK